MAIVSAQDIGKSIENAGQRVSDEFKGTIDYGVEQSKKIDSNTKSTWDKISENLSKSISDSLSSIETQFRSMLKTYSDNQQRIEFNLLNSGMSYNTVMNALNVLGTNSFVRQQKVYENLSNLVSQGITLNVAQRAFLQTASDQIGLGFQANNDALNRLIQLHATDLSEARVAQMAGLKEFLEQNYKNSQYIQQGFSNVSAQLLEMQSIMSTQMAMTTEKVIQTYLGSFSSAGGNANTMSSIATALGQIGSGDFSGLSEGMQNLMVMAASRAGLSYADLLTGGLDANKSEQLMTSLFTYIANMGNTAGGSNVAMSAIAKIFGVNVSDIRAAQNMNLAAAQSGYTSDIGTFLTNFAESTNAATRFGIYGENLMNRYALERSMTGLGLLGWDLETGASKVAGSLLSGFLPSLGKVVSNAGAIDVVLNMLGPLLGDLTTEDGKLKNIKLGGADVSGLISDYLALGGIDNSRSAYWRSDGSFVGGTSGLSSSGYASNIERNLTEVTVTGQQETRSTDDVYDLLDERFPESPILTATRLVGGENEVLIGNAEITNHIMNMITLTAVSTENILLLLEARFNEGQRTSSAYDWGDVFGGTRGVG